MPICLEKRYNFGQENKGMEMERKIVHCFPDITHYVQWAVLDSEVGRVAVPELTAEGNNIPPYQCLGGAR